jgi:hypothetical protein
VDSISVKKMPQVPYAWLLDNPEGYFEIEVYPEVEPGESAYPFKPELDFLHRGDVFEDLDGSDYSIVVAQQVRHGNASLHYVSWRYVAVPGTRSPERFIL